MTDATPASLIACVRVFWRRFAVAWAFPVLFLYGGTAADALGHPDIFFWLIAAPLFFGSYYYASRPWAQQRIRYWHGAFWVMVFPFLIWVAAVFSRLAIIRFLGGAHGA